MSCANSDPVMYQNSSERVVSIQDNSEGLYQPHLHCVGVRCDVAFRTDALG